MKLEHNVKKQHKGIVRDFNPVEQPEGTYTFALNAVNDSSEGDINNLVSEPSNIDCITLPSGYKIIGTIYGEADITYIFSTNNINSRIDKVDSKCNLTNLVDADLGFSTLYPIDGEYRVRRGCDSQLYWQDGFNSDRQFNENRPDDYKTSGDWDANKFNLKPNILPINIELEQITTGGSLEIGNYFFQVEILDEQLSVVKKSDITHAPVLIVDEPNNAEYFDIDGGYNIAQFAEVVGGVALTNKAITLSFSNLPTQFKYVRLVVHKAVSGDGQIITSHNVGKLIELNSTTLSYTYTGFNPSGGDTIIDYASAIVNDLEYNSSEAMVQIQNRLVRGNVKQVSKDYNTFQIAANSITSSYVVKQHSPFDNFSLGNPKNYNTYWERLAYMPDEVYAFAIIYVFSDGSISPAFHIPGRESIGNDIDELTVGTDLELADVQHLPAPDGVSWKNNDTVERWKVQNTSQGNGNMAFYETDTDYPSVLNCEGDRIYPEGKIRHHKFPSRHVENITDIVDDNLVINSVGIKFDNITYPSTDIVGHYFVRVDRDSFNTTVNDTGILFPVTVIGGQFGDDVEVYQSNLLTAGGGTQNEVIDNWIFTSPKTLINNETLPSGYFTTIADLQDSIGSALELVIGNWLINSWRTFDVSYTYTDQTNRVYDDTVYINPRSRELPQGNFDKIMLNNSYTNKFNYFHCNELKGVSGIGYFASHKVYKANLYNNLTTLRYFKTHSEMLTLTSDNEVFGGDTFAVELRMNDIYNLDDSSTSGVIEGILMENVFVDSTLNYELIHDGTGCNTRFRGNTTTELSNYHLTKITTFDSGTYTSRGDDYCLEFYELNPDLVRLGRDSSHIPLTQTYEYCNSCLTHNPFRVIFSPKSFDVEISDTYLINKTDDFIDLPAHRGEIKGLEYKNNQLLVHTEQTTFILQPNPQFIATDQNSAYLNTGDFLSIPPNELQQTDIGYGGLKHKFAKTNCKHGYIWLDTTTGDVIQFNNKIGTINDGLNQWLQDNLTFRLNDLFIETAGIDYPLLDKLPDDNGLGLKITYDDRFDRILIHKKDYQLAKGTHFVGIVNDLTEISDIGLYFNLDTNMWVYNGNGFTSIVTLNSRYFCNRSFTLSYSFRNSYVSFHSYLPYFMFYDNKHFYTVEGNKVLKHLHSKDYLSFNNRLYPFIIEWVENNYITSDLHSIHYIANFDKFENNRFIPTKDVNYTNLIVYNSYQNTGKQKLNLLDLNSNPFGNVGLKADEKNIIVTDGNSKVAGIYDMSSSEYNYSNSCSALTSEQLSDGYSENIPINIDFNKSQYNWGQLHDKYHFVKLFYYPQENNIKVTHQLTETVTQKSTR